MSLYFIACIYLLLLAIIFVIDIFFDVPSVDS